MIKHSCFPDLYEFISTYINTLYIYTYRTVSWHPELREESPSANSKET